MYALRIDNEIITSDDLSNHGHAMLGDSRREFYLFESTETAGQAAREYWDDMAHNGRREFVAVVGKDCLVSWALGEYAGPGSSYVSSLDAWLDLWLSTPEEHFASYDGYERDVKGPTPAERETADKYRAILETADTNCEDAPEEAEAAREIVEFVDGWEDLIEELGFEPGVAYRHN